jgi:hypothetical protein
MRTYVEKSNFSLFLIPWKVPKSMLKVKMVHSNLVIHHHPSPFWWFGGLMAPHTQIWWFGGFIPPKTNWKEYKPIIGIKELCLLFHLDPR